MLKKSHLQNQDFRLDDFSIEGQIADVASGAIFPGEIGISEGKIAYIKQITTAKQQLIMPGLIDAHVHVESSMLPPTEFARLAVVHGTVATISDPHEIGNVMGMKGVEYMVDNAQYTPFKFYFGVPSCVPATPFETAGAAINVKEVNTLLNTPEMGYLAEMMNFPGVLNKDPSVMKKIQVAKQLGKTIDGHAPGLRGEQAKSYADAGITSDHECFTLEEAKDKLEYGMKIMIREGSAAKNFDVLLPLLDNFPGRVMFCSDDKHPDALVNGHINELVAKALDLGCNPMNVLQAATLTPVSHYRLSVGLLQVGDPADFIVVRSLADFKPLSTYIDGVKVAENGRTLLPYSRSQAVNHFNCRPITKGDIRVNCHSNQIRVIRAIDRQLITEEAFMEPTVNNDQVVSDPQKDLLKLVVVNRYFPAKPAVAFVTGFEIKQGALASSVGHDSHNIISVGVDDSDIVTAINAVVSSEGGLSFACGANSTLMELPIAGLMSAENGYQVAKDYKRLDKLAKQAGSKFDAPYMTLSFLALLVIPQLKLSDKGLFDGKAFTFVNLFV